MTSHIKDYPFVSFFLYYCHFYFVIRWRLSCFLVTPFTLTELVVFYSFHTQAQKYFSWLTIEPRWLLRYASLPSPSHYSIHHSRSRNLSSLFLFIFITLLHPPLFYFLWYSSHVHKFSTLEPNSIMNDHESYSIDSNMISWVIVFILSSNYHEQLLEKSKWRRIIFIIQFEVFPSSFWFFFSFILCLLLIICFFFIITCHHYSTSALCFSKLTLTLPFINIVVFILRIFCLHI